MWPTWVERVAFVLLSHMGFSIIHFQIVLNHWDRPLTDESDMDYGDWLKMQVGYPVVRNAWCFSFMTGAMLHISLLSM
jgi:hypothetical protein